MKKLEYEIGNLDIKDYLLKFNGIDPYDAGHLFITTHEKGKIRLYVSNVLNHSEIVDRFSNQIENEQVVGGGSFYMDSQDCLNINDYSGSFKAIPRFIALNIGKKCIPILKEKGINVKGIKVNKQDISEEISLNSFWFSERFLLE